MGIYDRDYTQADSGADAEGQAGVLSKQPTVKLLILLNAAIFLFWLAESPALHAFMLKHFLVSATGVLEQHRWYTLLTYAISHQSFWHILFNMAGLWFFGIELEAIYGRRNLVVFYILTALAAGLAHVGFNLVRGVDNPALGASGAVMAMTLVCACFYPEREVLLFFAIPIRLKWLAVLYILWDLLGLSNPQMDNIGHAAHLGGIAAGYLFYRFDLRLFSAHEETRMSLLLRIKRAFRRKPNLKLVERPDRDLPVERRTEPEEAPSQRVDARTAARVDELLQKISAEGIGALTDEERAFLKVSSEKYKR